MFRGTGYPASVLENPHYSIRYFTPTPLATLLIKEEYIFKPKKEIMKKIILAVGTALLIFACNNAGDNSNYSSDSLQNNYQRDDSMNNNTDTTNNTDSSGMQSDTSSARQRNP